MASGEENNTQQEGGAKRHNAFIPENSLEKCLMYISDCLNPSRQYTRRTFLSSDSFPCERSDHRRESGPQHMMTRRHHPGPRRRGHQRGGGRITDTPFLKFTLSVYL